MGLGWRHSSFHSLKTSNTLSSTLICCFFFFVSTLGSSKLASGTLSNLSSLQCHQENRFFAWVRRKCKQCNIKIVQKLSYSPIHEFLISPKQYELPVWKISSTTVQMTMGSSYLVNPLSGWRDCFEIDLPGWRVKWKKKRGRILYLPAVYCWTTQYFSVWYCVGPVKQGQPGPKIL